MNKYLYYQNKKKLRHFNKLQITVKGKHNQINNSNTRKRSFIMTKWMKIGMTTRIHDSLIVERVLKALKLLQICQKS